MSSQILPQVIRDHYEIHEWKHACAILHGDFPEEWTDVCKVLGEFRLHNSWITVGGGRKSKVSETIDGAAV